MANNDYTKGFVIGALVGGIAGAVTALLLAPKSGAELRKDISNTTSEWYGKTADYMSDVERKVEESISKVLNRTKNKTQDIVEEAERRLNIIREANETDIEING